jgi:hypothetical protein
MAYKQSYGKNIVTPSAFKMHGKPHPKRQMFKNKVKTTFKKLGQNFKQNDNKAGLIGVGLSLVGLTGLGMKFSKQKKERENPNWR